MNTVTYRLKNITPKTWALKVKNAFGKKDINGYIADKPIGYFVGKDSCFVEDNPETKESAVPEFEFNESTGKTELVVPETNRALINYLETHAWFNKKYIRFDADADAKRDLERFESTEKALDFLKNKTGDDVIALGLLVIGNHAINMGEQNVLRELKYLAFNSPENILKVTNNLDFDVLIIGASAFVKGIVKTNDTKTAVVWEDSLGVIVRVAKGEKPIEKLSEFLTNQTDEARTTLQEMGNRVNGTKVTNNDSEDEIEELRKQYFSRFEQEVPNNMKNNAEWIKSKLE